MTYAERAYYEREPVQHCADREEWQRIERKRKTIRAALVRDGKWR